MDHRTGGKFSRRRVLGLAASSVAATALAAACQQAPAAPASTPASAAGAAATQAPSGPAAAKPTVAAAPAASSGSATTLSMWAFSLTPDSSDYLKTKVNADFQKKRANFTVEPQTVPYNGYRDKLAVALAGGTLPDIHEEGTQVAGRTAAGKEGIPVDDYIKDWADRDDFFEAAWQTSFYAGKHWGVPFYSSPSMILYWKSAYQEAGLDPAKPPVDDATYLDNAKKLQKVDKGATVRLGGWSPGDGQGLFQEFEVGLQRRGGKMADANYTQPLFSSPEGEATLEYLVSLWKAVYPEGVARLPEQSPIPHFAQKRIAEHARGHDVDANNVVKYNEAEWNDLGMAKPLIAKGGSKPVSIMWRNMIFVAPTSKFRDEAMDWVRTFTSTQHHGEYCRIQGYIPVRKSAIELPWVKESKFAPTYLRDASPYGYDVINPPNYFELRKQSGDQFEQAALGKITVKDAIQKVNQIWIDGLKNAPKVQL